ncbi:hypothetical protein [Actinoplanes sp. CA-252034]|uniref:hypothetical protein n=1 Tax=Actinoplanes sp. CA-252034 TaxID=3239906 RepID=UPI003D9739A7
MGKTTLALHLASLAGACHPDAHLFVDLHDHATTLLRSGDVDGAREIYARELRLARLRRQPYAVARATDGLADCLPAADPEALRLRREAHALYEELGVPPEAW